MKRWGIRTRVLLLALLPATATALLLAAYFVYNQIEDLERSLMDRGRAIARQLAPASEYGVFSGNRAILGGLARTALGEADVRSVTIDDARGNRLAAAGPSVLPTREFDPKPRQLIATPSLTRDSYVFRAPILQSEIAVEDFPGEQLPGPARGDEPDASRRTVLGWVTVEISREQTVARQLQLLTHSAALAALCLLGALVLAVRLGRDVVQPILTLTDTVKRVAGGDLDVRVSLHAGAELERLSTGINTMTAALKTAHAGLEARVEEATRRLKESLALVEQQNTALDAARRDAEAASRAKTEFLANMSHEIRTPINGLLGFIELFAKTTLDPHQRDYLHTIETSASHLLSVINDILDFSKIEAGKMQVVRTAFAPRRLLEENITLIAPRARAKGLEVTTSVDPALPERLLGDPTRIAQILGNLLTNAVKFTHQGYISVEVTRTPQRDNRIGVRVAVRDTGSGIPRGKQSQLFESFTQLDADTARRHTGTGLGLAICKRLVEAMGGKIGVDSEPGHGSVFWFELALPEAADAPLPPAAGTTPAFTQPGANAPNVLLVEDNEISRRFEAAALRGLGAVVDEAVSGAEAVALCWHKPYDLILMDIHMPGTDGIAATGRIRSTPGTNRRTPIVALTADVVRGSRERFLTAGMDDLLTKPVTERALRDTIIKWCPLPSAPVAPPDEAEADAGEPHAVLDRTLGVELASGDPAIWETSVRLLVEALGRQLDGIDTAVRERDYARLVDIAHSLKGSAAYCAAAALRTAAVTLETAARAQDQTAVAHAAAALRHEAERVVQAATQP